MNIHEYQAKELLHSFGVPVLKGRAVFSAADAGAVAYADFVLKGAKAIVVKAQIHAGGRGKGTVHNPETGEPIQVLGKPLRGVTVITEGNLSDRAYQVAQGLLSNKLVTIQTGAEGKIVRRSLSKKVAASKKNTIAQFFLTAKPVRM